MQFAMEDWWITDYQAYFNQTEATFTIDALESTEVLTLSLYNREKLCADMHKIEHFFRKKSNNGYIAPVSYTHLDVYKRQVLQSF